jgi:hypothetical protein
MGPAQNAGTTEPRILQPVPVVNRPIYSSEGCCVPSAYGPVKIRTSAPDLRAPKVSMDRGGAAGRRLGRQIGQAHAACPVFIVPMSASRSFRTDESGVKVRCAIAERAAAQRIEIRPSHLHSKP